MQWNKSPMDISHFLLFGAEILCFLFRFSSGKDTITFSQTLTETQTLVSKDGTFEMGFFSPGAYGNRYVGVWHKNIPAKRVVWVANRINPVNGSCGVMMLDQSSGNLVIMCHNTSVVLWSSNSSRKLDNPVAQLLDSGNLVLRDEKDGDNSDLFAWQSFDYPSDTLLAGMKLGWDAKSGLDRRITAWKSPDDPSPGEMMLEMELTASPELVLWKGSLKITRSGPWVGTKFSDMPELQSNPVYDYEFVFSKVAIYYAYHLKSNNIITITAINETRSARDVYVWIEAEKTWQLYVSAPRDSCDSYGLCGANGICSTHIFPVCKCLVGFVPKSPAQWNLTDWSQGCVRDNPLNCSRENGFKTLSGVKLPDTTNCWLNQSMNLKECKEKCLSNCSCMAYTNSDFRKPGTGCTLWFNDLIDIKQLQDGGQNLYVRMPFQESGHGSNVKRLSAVIASSICFVLVTLLVGYCIYRRRRSTIRKEETVHDQPDYHIKQSGMELPVFDLATIVEATDGFSTENKLGRGGFGIVYKGTLKDGQEIAVKRLSSTSGQGQNEFRNEVMFIAKLQHRNLVKLLGCCIEGVEKMLIYEYLPNRSLDHYIYDRTLCKVLDWPRRFNIICGIARGLLYLHQDSRLRIVHRDLKPSNVLLDNQMNPKISDFGMAKTFGGDQTEGKTNRVVGTYGYMAPEYATNGFFSIKSDVYSFGVLLLEIVSGKRNTSGLIHLNGHHLIGHAWNMWTEGRALELLDVALVETYSSSEVMLCIHIGLLCVQKYPQERPSMASVVLMLGSENELPQPNQPAFFMYQNPNEAVKSSSGKNEEFSVNENTMSTLRPR